MLLSVVIATHQRVKFLEACLQSLLNQNVNFEVIIAHSGAKDNTKDLSDSFREKLKITYLACTQKGAASQRNEGVQHSKGEWIVFIDDDVVVRPDFLEEICTAIKKFPHAGGVCGSIENQFYEKPGALKRLMLRLIGIGSLSSLAGKVKGPALNFLPEKEGNTFEEIDWMPTCVCAYSKDIFEQAGKFPSYFRDYSFGEDLYLSYKISRKHRLILNRKAILYHNDLGGKDHKNWKNIALMQMCNRLYIIKHAMREQILLDRFKLYVWHNINGTGELLKGKKNLKVFLTEMLGYTQGLFTRIP